MISYIKGIIAAKNENSVVLDVGGIGYLVFMPSGDIARIGEVGDAAEVNTYFHIRDEQPELYGFASREELDYFGKLISISGVGPKAAVSLLGSMSTADLAFAVLSEDVKAITRAPGIGTKMAQRIILELKGKIDTADAVSNRAEARFSPQNGGVSLRRDTEAVNALIALGASPSEAQKTVMQIDCSSMSVEDIIKEALRRMSNGI